MCHEPLEVDRATIEQLRLVWLGVDKLLHVGDELVERVGGDGHLIPSRASQILVEPRRPDVEFQYSHPPRQSSYAALHRGRDWTRTPWPLIPKSKRVTAVRRARSLSINVIARDADARATNWPGSPTFHWTTK